MYINIDTQAITHAISIKNVSLPLDKSEAILAHIGYAKVVDADMPLPKRGRVVSAGQVIDINGTYTQTWNTDDTAVDLMGDLRADRDNLLTHSDYTQATDTTQTVTDKAAWATYRQALRDLPATTLDLENVVWPDPPGAPVAVEDPLAG